MTTVAVAGSVNLDAVVAVARLPEPGETVLGSDVALRPGGKGANQAVAARRLGAEAVLLAATGADGPGADLRAALEREGVDVNHVAVRDGAATGAAFIVVDAAGENTIVVAPGANHLPDGITLCGLRSALSRATVLSLQLEIPLSACLDAAAMAREAGVTVLLNAAPLPEPDDERFVRLLSLADVLVVNESEAARLSGQAPPRADDAWVELARRLRRLGPRMCVITRGADGAVAVAGEAASAQPAFPVAAVDATGAGDCFCGALAVSLAAGDPLDQAMRRACAAGALATTKLGAQEALPTAADVDRLLERERSG